MPQKKRGHDWTRIKGKRKCKRPPKPEYQHPLTVRDWKSICCKSLRLVKQCYWNHPEINMWDCEIECPYCFEEKECKFWRKYDWYIKRHYCELSTMDPDSFPSAELFLDLTKSIFSVLLRNQIPDLNFSLFSCEKSKFQKYASEKNKSWMVYD